MQELCRRSVEPGTMVRKKGDKTLAAIHSRFTLEEETIPAPIDDKFASGENPTSTTDPRWSAFRLRVTRPFSPYKPCIYTFATLSCRAAPGFSSGDAFL